MSQGLLFVGDPHLSSRRPGRRIDKDFAGTVLDKLYQGLSLSRERGWQPVFLGDLFDSGGDNGLSMLTRLLRLLRGHKEAGGDEPLCLVGNHDLRDADLSDDTALGMLRETGLIRICETREIPEIITIPGVAHILPVSYGKDRAALSSVAMDARKIADLPIIALTHEDFDFQGAYPGASLMEEIHGVDMVVNGHMHKPAPWVQKGQTLWCNPGNITRMSVDCANIAPSVWSWTPKMGVLAGLERHILEYEVDVFDMTGLRIGANDAALKEDLQSAMAGTAGAGEGAVANDSSLFAQLLKDPQFGTMTDDATVLQEELESVMAERKTDEITAGILLAMVKTVAEDIE